MIGRFIAIVFLIGLCFTAKGQVIDTLTNAEKISRDSLNMQDTTNIPHGRNSKPVQKQEPVIYKDSTRLALENLTRTAVRKSAIIPGWGQIQNGKWWKVPFVVAGFGGVVYSFNFAQKNYKLYLSEAQYRFENPTPGEFLHPELANAPTEFVIEAKDFYRRNRDLSVLGGVGFYALQLIDAYIDAKFFRYDIDDNFSFNIKPSFESNPMVFASNRVALGLKLAVRIN